MKIKDLEFKEHYTLSGTQAIVSFPNGYAASILTGGWFYTDDEHPYEIAVMTSEGAICYGTPITDDVVGYLTEDEANEILKKISELPKREVSK